MKWNYYRPTEEEIEAYLWSQTWAEDDPRYERYVKARKEIWDPWRNRMHEKYKQSLKDNPEWHAQFKYNYFEYCLKFRIWHKKSKGHPDSPWSNPNYPV